MQLKQRGRLHSAIQYCRKGLFEGLFTVYRRHWDHNCSSNGERQIKLYSSAHSQRREVVVELNVDRIMEKIRLGVPHRTRMTAAELLHMVEDEDGTGLLGVEEMVASFAEKGNERSLLVDAIGSTILVAARGIAHRGRQRRERSIS